MLLPLRNFRQQEQADCLVACATMVLQYLGIDSNYRRLFRLLGASDAGTPFFNIERLTTLGLFARWQRYGSLDLVQQYLELGLPVIVAVRTWALPHWHPTDNEHAIVVVGFDDEAIYVNDPFFNEAPLLIPRERFLNGWADRDEQFALISLIESLLSCGHHPIKKRPCPRDTLSSGGRFLVPVPQKR